MAQPHKFQILSQKELHYFYYAFTVFCMVGNLMDNLTLGQNWATIFALYNWVNIGILIVGLLLLRFKKLTLKTAFAITVYSLFLNLLLSNITDIFLGENYVLCLLRQTIFVCFLITLAFLFISRIHGIIIGCTFSVYYTVSTVVSHDSFLISNLGNILFMFMGFVIVLNFFQKFINRAIIKIQDDTTTIRDQNEELTAINQEITAVNEELSESQKQITAQHEELLTLSESVSMQNHMLEEKNTKLEDAILQKSKLFSIIAHDLKSPISSITSLTELMLEKFEEMPEEKKKMWLSKILNSNNLLYELLENLLIWSRSQTGSLELNPVQVNLEETIEKITAINKNYASQKSVTFRLDVPEAFSVYADKMMIETILRNLISNAIKYSFENGEVTVSAHQGGHYVQISVQDSGVGIKEEQIKTLLSSNDIKSTLGTLGEKGTGLGLRISKEFIEMHNGKMWLESKNGTTVYFELPFMHNKLTLS